MRNKLDSNVSWLMVYFNVMIMAKAFRTNENFSHPECSENQEINSTKIDMTLPNEYEGDSEVTACGNLSLILS